LKEKDENLTGEDIREGQTVIISVKLREPQFEGQTKAKLGTPDARTAVETVVNTELADWLERNPNDARDIMAKVLLASKARIAAKAARETVIRKGALEGFTSILAPLNSFSTNFSPTAAQKGQTVSVPLYGTIANADNFGGNYTTNSDQTINEVAVTLNQHFYKTIHTSDTDAANGVDNYKLAYQAGQAVAKSVFTGAMGALNVTRATNGTYAHTLGDVSQFGPSGVLALRGVAANWPERNLITTSTAFTALLGNLPANQARGSPEDPGSLGSTGGEVNAGAGQ